MINSGAKAWYKSSFKSTSGVSVAKYNMQRPTMHGIKCQNSWDGITWWIRSWCCHVGIHASFIFCRLAWWRGMFVHHLTTAPLVINVLCITETVTLREGSRDQQIDVKKNKKREWCLTLVATRTWGLIYELLCMQVEQWHLRRWICCYSVGTLKICSTDILHCVLQGDTCDSSILFRY